MTLSSVGAGSSATAVRANRPDTTQRDAQRNAQKVAQRGARRKRFVMGVISTVG